MKLKLKGCYVYGDDLEIHKNHSMQVVAKTAVKHLTEGVPIMELLKSETNPLYFLVTIKVPKSNILLLGDNEIQKTGRYVVTNTGDKLSKIMPSTGVISHYKKAAKVKKEDYESWDNSVYNPELHTKNGSVHADRQRDVLSGFLVTDCNDIRSFNFNNINWEFYKKEVDKIVQPLLQ